MLAIKEELLEIEKGWTMHLRTMPIIENVDVVIYDDKEAVLRINEEDVIEFTWTEEAESMIAEIDTAETIEVFELLARLNRQLTDRMAQARAKRAVAV